METLVTVIHVTVSVFLVIFVLLQAGKGAGMGAAFGGGSATVFGGRGPATFLQKLTTAMAIIFMLTSIALAKLATKKESVMAGEGAGGTPAAGAAVADGGVLPADAGAKAAVADAGAPPAKAEPAQPGKPLPAKAAAAPDGGAVKPPAAPAGAGAKPPSPPAGKGLPDKPGAGPPPAKAPAPSAPPK